MKKIATELTLFVFLFALCAFAQDVVGTALRANLNLNGTWQYQSDQPESPIPTSGWSETRVPALPITDGTWSAWYETTITIPSSWMITGRRFFIDLDKAGHYAGVYLNGTLVGQHYGQFSPFEFEVTSQLLVGANTLQIYVHNAEATYVRANYNMNQSSCPSTFPNCMAESYRPHAKITSERNWIGLVGDVTFEWRPAQYISDVAITTSFRNLTIQDVAIVTGTGTGASIAANILDANGNLVFSIPQQLIGAPLLSSWLNPVLWGPAPYGQPYLYTLATTLLDANGNQLDQTFTRFGFREVWVAGTQILLNGIPLWMASTYPDPLAGIRTVNDRRPEAYMLYVMQQSGMNGVDVHWDDIGTPWLDLADEMGMLVLGGFYCTGIENPAPHIDSQTGWMDWMEQTAGEWITAEKNHPSIILLRPIDVSPGGITAAKIDPALKSVIQPLDPSSRPFVDGTDVTNWSEDGEASPTTCNDGSDLATALATMTKPLFIKEVYGLGLVCTPQFVTNIYNIAYSGDAAGIIYQELPLFTPETFTPTWFSLSGVGNRPTVFDSSYPNWIARIWSPSQDSVNLAALYEMPFGGGLLSTSPSSGDFQTTGIPTTAPTAFLIPQAGAGIPMGVTPDENGDAWIVTPLSGAMQFAYNPGSGDVIQDVTVEAAEPF